MNTCVITLKEAVAMGHTPATISSISSYHTRAIAGLENALKQRGGQSRAIERHIAERREVVAYFTGMAEDLRKLGLRN